MGEEKSREIEVCIQYRDQEGYMDRIVERIKNDYFSRGNTQNIERMQIYLKPEESTAYYVINDGVVGKVYMYTK